MENSRLKKLKTKKSLAGILLVVAVIVLAGIIKIGSVDKLKGTIKVTEAYLSNVTTKLSANISDVSGTGPVTSNGYDEVNYELKYRLSESNQTRDVIINGSLDSDSGYASFKRITGDNLTCTLSDNDRKIEIVISNVPSDTEITTNIPIIINGAPNGYRVNPTFKIKESTAENYTDIYTNPIEVSTNSLRGTVKNENGERVSNVIVSIYKNRRLVKETYTNDNGEYIFSDIPQDTYSVIVNEEIYETVDYNNVSITGDSTLDLIVKRIYPFTLETHKYITKVDVNNLGNLISKTYNNVSLVNFPVKRLNNLYGKVYYKIVVENVGQKDGIVSVVKDELPSFMTFNKEENNGFELIDGIIYDRNLEGVELLPGQRVEDTLVLNINNTNEAREYLNRVTVTGDIYEHVVYILDGNVYKELDVLEGEKLDRISDPANNFSGWYTDSEYTNKYNYNNPVLKNLILYGKTGQKYTVEFYDKDPENGDEELYTTDEVNGGDPVDEPNDHPEHTGYNFDYWCKTDYTEYNFREPVNSNLKLISCYTIKEYDVNFYNYSDSKEKTIKVEYKKLIDQTEAPTFDETGFSFICWSKDKTNCFDFTTPVVENIDLYPIHERLTNAVIFNDENRVTTVDNIPYGDKVTPIASQGKEGHTFGCWSEDRILCFDFDTPIIKTTTLYAVYVIDHYTVNFVDRNPDTLVETPYGDNQTIPYGSTATKPAVDPEHYGYTFNEWTKEDGTSYNFETPVKSDLTLYSKYDINSYPVRFHDGSDVTTVNVVYKNKVTPIDNPTKEHHLFINWLKEDDTVYDFDLPVISELDLYSNYEEILPPVISHVPTMWTNEDVTASLAPNPALTDYTGYTYQYKVGTGNYSTYSDSFNVSENTTITAKASKSDVDSTVVNHEIINIDKLNPSITLFSESVANKNSATLNVNSIDNESGINYYEVYVNNVKVGEKHFECYDETTFEGYEACRSTLPAERTSTYTVTGLSPSTTYTVKVKVFDKAGNFVFSNDLEITTTTPQIVARLIGYNNALFEDTVDSATGDVIAPKEDKYINFESLEEAFDYEDLYDCKNVQCTIQMVTGTDESVQVLEGQNLTLDLNGKVVSGIIPEYTIKNNGSFTIIESTPEDGEIGKLVNNLGVAILNKADSYLTLGEGYSESSVAGSIVSTTKPYVYGEVNGVKNETNGHFSFFDGKIVSPQSQNPGYGAVNGRVTGTEYSYEAVSNPETIGDRNYQVVTLNRLTSPEARINNSVYYGKLASAMNDANRGTTTLYDDNNAVSIMSEVKAKGGYSFVYDETTGKLISNSGAQYNDRTRSYVVIDLTNEVNDKVLSIDYTPEYGEEVYSDTYDFLSGRIQNIDGTGGPYYIFNVSKVENYSKNILGETIAPYRHDTSNYSFELKKGEIYYLDLQFFKYGNDYYYGQERLEELIIDSITLSDLDKKTNNFELLSDVNTTEYGFYYEPSDGTIRSNNQYVGTTSSAYGAIELDLTNYDPDKYYYITINYSMESYSQRQNWNESAVTVGKINYSESKTGNYRSIGTEFYASGEFDINRVHESMNRSEGTYGGWKTYGPRASYTSLPGGKKYYLNFAYEKLIRNPENYPSREEFEAAGCSDQLIIHSIDVYERGDSNTNYLTKIGREIENNIMEELVNNSNGEYVSNGTSIITNNTRGKKVYTYANIDLTNDELGETLVIDYKNRRGIINGNYSSYIDIETDYYDLRDIINYNQDQSYIGVFQKRIINGEEKLVALQGIDDYTNWEDAYITGNYRYGLQGGYEYEVRFYTITPDGVYDTYPNFEIDSIRTVKVDEFEGNYFNGITGSRYFANNTAGTPKSNYRDSFIKLDLTNYEYDQQLYFNVGTGDYSNNKIYLTDNNRALTQEELYNNKGDILSGYGYDNTVILEKGKIYYLHIANSGIDYINGESNYAYNHINDGNWMSYYEWGATIDGLYMYPILSHVISIGGNKIFTGTLDVANTREESSYIGKRDSSEPVFIKNYSTYGFSYNEETGMYDSLNTEPGDIAVKTFKLDLTESATDKTYSFITNNSGDRNLYGVSDGDSAPSIELSSYVELYNDWKYTIPANYYKINERPTFTLEKGKVYYIQVLTFNSNSTLSFKLDEMNTDNVTNEFYPIREIKEFNENVDTVQLLRSVNATNALEVDSSEEVILDLNGYDLSSSDDYIIKNFGKLTVYDSKYRTKLESYDSDLAEYQEYAGLCDGCSVSEEYKLDHILDYLDEYGIDISNPDPNSIYDFDYTGAVQEFVVPETGIYKLQVWGAQGGYRRASYNGGKGGYSEGIIELKEGETIYVFVGGSGNTGGTDGGFNGGGSRDTYNGGGGASDIRVEGDSLFNRIIVAGGGGSDGATNRSGGYGGGASGSNTEGGYGDGGTGATQTTPGDSGGVFGRGGTGVAADDGYGGAGGGGWFGGGGATPDGSGDDDKGGGGGSGFIYTNPSSLPVSGYSVNEHFLLSGKMLTGNDYVPSPSGSGGIYGKEDNGYAKISLLVGDEIVELRNNLPKTYNIKSEPRLDGMSQMSNGSGTGIIYNNRDASLTLSDVKLDVSSKYGVYNEGTIIASSSPIVNINTTESVGIYNVGGDIVNNGTLKFNLKANDCSILKEYGATAIEYSSGVHDLSNVSIEGKRGTGIKINPGTEVRIHSSNIDVNEIDSWGTFCVVGDTNNALDKTSTVNSKLYDKNFSYYFRALSVDDGSNYYADKNRYSRNDGSIYNAGTVRVDEGSTLSGQVTNFGNAALTNGTTFNKIYQNDAYKAYNKGVKSFDNPTISIQNTTASVKQFVNNGGTISIIEDENETTSISAIDANKPAILNFDKANFNGGLISSMYNMGELVSNNTSYDKLYNLHTINLGNMCSDYNRLLPEFKNGCNTDVKGTANIIGGSINNEMLVNENSLVLDSVSVPNGIMNRGNLTVKGNSEVIGNDKPAIQNIPFLIKYYVSNVYSWDMNKPIAYNFVRTSLTIGDNDGNVNEGPIIKTTNNSYAISGDCHPMGTVGLDDYELESSESGNMQAKIKGRPLYRDMNGRVVTLDGAITSDNEENIIHPIDSIEYPNNSDNLCDIKYYDGTIKSVSTSNNMTDIVYIPISDIEDGYDVRYDNNGNVTLDTIDSDSREGLIEVNGTTYKSLQTAINNAPSDSIINISGNYDTANRVVIPQNKSLTINYASGSRVNSYSKEPLVTNNGILNITGSGSSSIIGQTGFENNNTMTFSNGNFNNVYTQSNLVKNNADLTFDNVKSNGLDIISTTDNDEKINLTINNGEFGTNTIYANNTNVTVKGGYFYSGEGNENYEAYYADSTTEKEVAHTKQLFNAHNSIVTFDNFNVDDDTRYNSITNESNLGRFVDTTLNLNNSKFGGKSSKSRIYTTILNDGGKSIANINGGEYTNLRFTYRGNGNEYNQASGIVNGSLLLSGGGHNVNITGGKISTNEDAILIKDGSGISVTVGTKGDLKPGTNKLNVSKTEPEIRGGTFGISETGSSYSQNNLYFYDGVFKASSNPIDAHIEDIETGYDVIYDNLKSPKEKYLDILPLVLNYTTGVYYYDAQEAFNAANTDDKLIWTRDYTNFSDTPTLVIPSGKKFELYFSYGTAEYKPIYYRYYESDNPPTDPLTTTSQDEFEPYDGTGSFVHSGMSARQTSIRINNTSYVDENTGETIERPFIINNGDVTIYGDASSFGGGDPILDVMSRTSAIVNNGTLRFNKFSIRNVKSNKTMIENNGTMEIYRSDFVSYQSNVITNNGTLDFVGDDNDTTSCYIPTSIKVHSDQSIEDAINYYLKNPSYDIRSFLSETIINNQNATMNIKYLVVDSDYTYTVLLNKGTLNIEHSFIETYKNDDISRGVSAGKSIINHGEMTANVLQLFTEKGIENLGELTLDGSLIDAAYDTAITNSGILTMNSGSIYGARKGIVDTGTTTISGYIMTYDEAYHGEGYGEANVHGSLNTYGINTGDYSVNYSIPVSCTTGNDNRRTVSGSPDNHIAEEYPQGYYNKNNAAVYLGPDRTFKITGGFVGLDSNMPIYHFCDYTYDGHYRHEQCSAPYPNGSGDGTNYSVAAIESNGGNIILNGGTIYHGSNSDYKYAVNMYSPNWNDNRGSVTITSGYISKIFSNTGTVTMGVVDDATNSNFQIGSLSCRYDSIILNIYDGSVFLDKDHLCHFTDKEENFTIYRSSGGPYALTNDTTVVTNVDQDESYSSVRTAISNANPGEKLRFVNSVSEVTSDYDITVDKDITIDLNGSTLDANVIINNSTLTLTDEAYIADNEKEKGKLTNITVQDGTVNIIEGLVDKIKNNDTVNVSGGSINYFDNGTNDVSTVSATLNATGGKINLLTNYQNCTANIDSVTGSQFENNSKFHDSASDAIMNITNSKITFIENDSTSFTLGTGAEISQLINNSGRESNPLILTDGKISRLDNTRYLTIDGSEITLLITIDGVVTMNSGSIKNVGVQKRGSFVMNGGTIESITNDTYGSQHGYKTTINNGTVGTITNEMEEEITILGGELNYINNKGKLTIGTKDGIVNTNSPKIINNKGYAISSTGSHDEVNIYDGFFKSNKSIVIDATIVDSEPGYSPYVAPEYDDLGVLTGKHIMYLKHTEELDTKIACVQGICYDTLQQAIDASVQNYTEQEGCPEVKIGDEFYFSVELTEDLVLDPQYSLTINLNYHNINDNGYTIPDNITLRNGSRNGTDLQSNISKLLSNIFGINDNGKDIIITRMEDGNPLDTSKTYNLYKFENGSYELQKVKSDGAGKYSIGRGTNDLKPIKGRIYINDLEAGEYKLEDNYNNEIIFTIYDDGHLSSNIKENIVTDYGHLSASSVATLVITIQTGMLKINYALIALSIVVVLVVMFVLRRRTSNDN